MAAEDERIAEIRRLAAEGDIDRLAGPLVGDLARPAGRWHAWGVAQIEILAELTAEQRARLVALWSDRHAAIPEEPEAGPDAQPSARDNLLLLVMLAAEGLGPGLDPLPAERAAYLGRLARYPDYWYAQHAELFAEAELAAGRTLSAEVVAVLRRTAQSTYRHPGLLAVLRKLTEPPVNPGEAWSDDALATAALLGDPWPGLLRLAVSATSARPSPRWEEDALALVGLIGADAVRDKVLHWLALAVRPRTVPLLVRTRRSDPNALPDPYNADAVRGLAWLVPLLPPDPGAARVLGALVEGMLRRVPGIGPRNPKIANAAVLSLARCEGDAALAELARLAARVTYKGTLKQIDAALEARAAALGLSREEVEELAVPGYGLTEVGLLRHPHGELAVVAGKAVLSWRNAAGKPVKGVPAAVRRDHAEDVAALKTAAKDVDKMLGAQAERLDRQFLARRSWRYDAWRQRYLDHPLVGTLARRLLWTVGGQACGFADGELRTLSDAVVPPGGTVELWHPVGREPAEVVAWRAWLERHGVTQPFKQAHREVYLLTDAERTTGTYSNRFAAHVLRQHQFHSLAAVRGWHNKLRLAVDDSYPPAIRELPRWGLRAEFWIEGSGDGHDLSESGSYLHLVTDQVRFYPIDAPRNTAHAGGGGYSGLNWRSGPSDGLPLEEVPALVLSEVLRDVDLFVGVASVGNDPTWQDGGPAGRYRAYWHDYGFGDLTQTAATRRDLLARLVPRLAVADRCTIEGRFLHVRGDLHTYKIHLGSGNILIAPQDRYLCVIPKSVPNVPDAGYLPFEGDRTLSVILSKAMLLARDTAITDGTILSQL